MELREMGPDDRGAVLDLLEHAFGVRELFERYMDHDPAFSPGDFLLALDDDRALVACVQIFHKTIRLRGQAVSLGGIGSVATRAAQRGQGVSSTLLERAIERMREQEMKLSLLFAAPIAPLYERLGWLRFPLPLLRLTPKEPTQQPPASAGRAFAPADLEPVKALYEAYTEKLSGPTVRDARYWRGQLRTAGTPEEDFRVAEQRGKIRAYARIASFNGRLRGLEYARDARGAKALAQLLAAHAYGPGTLHVPYVHDPELAEALDFSGIATKLSRDPGPMWRVLDRAVVARLAGLPESSSDEALLTPLVGAPALVYWPSDRF
ncbi:MAG TPA: GNAT family N-acetyltransferase [Myxococcota bacterium]|nr:GNAT family N-acetyltransferase [Myxococcota bacterium]